MFRTVYRNTGITAGLLMIVATGTWAAAQRGDAPQSRATPPSGAEIPAAARAARLDTGNVGTSTMFGKPFKFTPVQVPAKPAQAPAKADRPGAGGGDFIGVLENGAVGDETGLPPGKYNLFVANVNGQLKGYAEANGQIVKEAIRVTSTPATAGAKGRPQFIEKGWSVRVYLCDAWIWIDGVWSISCRWRTVSF